MTRKTAAINLIVLVGSAALGLILCEALSRIFLNSSDYLSVEMVQDNVLGAVPAPGTKAGFDAWGFRNREVPKTADIVAIGDSHTYGNTATMDESWPYVLGHLAGQRVYNMGMGGYGPNQYAYLLETRALALKPRLIICGLYMGDDFENAFLITHGLDHWAYLRETASENIDPNIWEKPTTPSWHKKIRVWLSRHSVIYQLLFHGSLVGRLQGQSQIKYASRLDDAVTSLVIPEKNILEAFRPKSMVKNLDQESPLVREGMDITFKLLSEMNDVCHRNHIQFVVAVIPTKEMVFSNYIGHNPKLSLGGVLDKLLLNEGLAREKTFRFLADSNISYVDTLPALRKSVQGELYARTAADMHPNKNGYRVIAGAVFEALQQSARNGAENTTLR